MIHFIKHNKVLSILLFVSVLAIITGIIFYAKLDGNSKEIVATNIQSLLEKKENKIGVFLSNQLISISSIWVLGISIIGLPLILLIYLYLLFIFSFEGCALLVNLGIKNMMVIMLYLIPKAIMILCTFFLCYYAISFSLYLWKHFVINKDIPFKEMIKRYKKIYGISLLGLIISTILEYINIEYLLNFFY